MENNNLANQILNLLRYKYLPPSEIFQKLRNGNFEFEEKKFYPILSELVLNNFLCYNWKRDKNGVMLKNFHLTKNGLNYLNTSN
jgi:DNA-binding PadR family transcriptional regulator